MGATIGIDVGGTKVYVAAAEQCQLVDVMEIPVGETLDELTGQIVRMVNKLSERVGRVERIGVGIPGAVLPDGLCWVPNLPFLTNVRLASQLEHVLDAKVTVANDAQLALLGELSCGAARGHMNVVLVSIGTGVGGAIAIDGKVIRGANGTAGALGWLTVGGRIPTFTLYETTASGVALNNLSWQACNMTSYELIAAVKNQEPVAVRVFNQWAENVSQGILSIVSILDPEVVLITGGLSRESELLLPRIREVVSKFSSPLTRGTYVRAGKLLDKATLYGAIRLAQVGTS